jgi:uncharacterized protein (TIGR03382 family)
MASAIEPVLTQHNDVARTGAYLTETTLNTSNVASATFGKLFSRPVDDEIYAQPLYVPDVTLPGAGVHDVVYVATVADSVYAFDADDPDSSAPLWHTSLLDPGGVPPSDPDISAVCGDDYSDFTKNFGIVGTPVIDPTAGILYVVGRSKLPDGTFNQKLHALDITTGAEQLGGPVLIQPSSAGTGDGSTTDVFNPLMENQRPGLLLSQGMIYIAWASHDDCVPYHGWVEAFDAQTLQVAGVFNDTPDGQEGGIWMGGVGPSADANGNVFLSTGNGTTDATDYSSSILKFSPTLQLESFFTPWNYAMLNMNDLDLAASGVLLIPGTNLAIGGGKSGVFYVVNQSSLGGLSAQQNDSQIVQSFLVGNNEILSGPVFYNGPTGAFLYVWMEYGNLKAYPFDPGLGLFDTSNVQEGTIMVPCFPGAQLSLSANGTTPGTAILWALFPLAVNGPGMLRAFDATHVTTELWNSEENSTRDSLGQFAKFAAPTIANGRVYVPTFSRELAVYGTLPPTITQQPAGQTLFAGQPLSLSVGATGASLSYQWRMNGASIARATGTTYQKQHTVPSDQGTYDVLVTNSTGKAQSAPALVTVNGAPTITSQPSGVSTAPGKAFKLTVVASGVGLQYQWRKNGTAIAGATSAAFTKSEANSQDAGSYDVVVSNPAGSITSKDASVAVAGARAAGCSCSANGVAGLLPLALALRLVRRRRPTGRLF